MATRNKTSITLAASAAMTASIALSPMTASADANPFATTELSGGYMQLAEGKCGEAKCGANKKAEEAKCGADKKAREGRSAENKTEEGKCGEAKCGANK